MKIESLDHVALWVADRDRARRVPHRARRHARDRAHRQVHDRRRRRPPRQAHAVRRRGTSSSPARSRESCCACADLEQALADLPADLDVPARDRTRRLHWTGAAGPRAGPGGGRRLRPRPRRPRASATRTPPSPSWPSSASWPRTAGYAPARRTSSCSRQRPATERPLLNHLGLRVESADEHIDEARDARLEIADVVDAANTYALFVWGPERVKLEYVEHKASFSLV